MDKVNEKAITSKTEIVVWLKEEILRSGILPPTWVDMPIVGIMSTDTCHVCQEVFSDLESSQAERDNVALCDNCRVDLMVTMIG